jgi:hypothetical protein
MNAKIQAAITTAISKFSVLNDLNEASINAEILNVFSAEDDFISKVESLDAFFDGYPQLEALREVFFDLLLMNFFSDDVKKLEEDYLDSDEWAQIEEDTIDRGTELLNVLLYLNECDDEGIEPELEDFLKEFLLVDEDEFQDEHRIYEDMIANQILMDSTIEQIAATAAEVDEESELKELFYPTMSFFYEPAPTIETIAEVEKHAIEKDFDVAVYHILLQFYKA